MFRQGIGEAASWEGVEKERGVWFRFISASSIFTTRFGAIFFSRK
jgi:hypothetical protein